MPITGLEIPILSFSIDGVNFIVKKFRVKRAYSRSNKLMLAAVDMVTEVKPILVDNELEGFHEHSRGLSVLMDAFHAEMAKGYLIPGSILRGMAEECKLKAKALESEAITISARAKIAHLSDRQPLDSLGNNAGANTVKTSGNINIGGNVVHNHYMNVNYNVNVHPGETASTVPDAATVRETVSNALSTELSHFSDVQATQSAPPPVDPRATTSYVAELVTPPEVAEDTNNDAHAKTPTTVNISMEWWKTNH